MLLQGLNRCISKTLFGQNARAKMNDYLLIIQFFNNFILAKQFSTQYYFYMPALRGH